MNKRELQKAMRDIAADPEKRRQNAYHESGHAVILFMFCNHYDIEQINMFGTFENHAHVRMRSLNLKYLSSGMGKIPVWMQLQAKMKIMYFLGGYAAEGRVGKYQNEHWFQEEIDSGDWEFSEGEDINKAVSLAKVVWGDNGQAWKILRRLAAWTDEALSHPRLWSVVNALSERLIAVKRRISGGRVCKIMEDAWGEPGLPCMEMGRQWRRRFNMKGATIDER
ncbi:MAG: hypothetical protein JXB10_01465 [Pirellulales bacterium]|nr:hypothetical protein [Pirellulales bacterium]